MRAFIIDDESAAIKVLKIMLKAYEDVEVVGEYTDPYRALEEIDDIKPEIIFLDIEMEGLSGLELAEDFLARFDELEIVFVTAYTRYAVEAFELNVIDYLLKPIEEDRLDKTIKRLREKLSKTRPPGGGSLYVRSLNNFQVFYQSSPLKWRTLKTKELFCYLWLMGEVPVSKHLILEDIFMDKNLDAAIAIMHTTVYQLRKSLRDLGFDSPISYHRHCYKLNIPLESDVDELRRLGLKPSLTNRDVVRLLEIYRMDLLLHEGYHWALGNQRELQNIFIGGLLGFCEKRLAQGNCESLVGEALEKIYGLDLLNDDIAEMLLIYHGKSGKKVHLKHFFDDYCRAYMEEMGTGPSSRITSRYKKLIKD